MSDDALLAACAKGDTVALGALFDRFYPDVYRFIFRMSGCDASDLDDLVQTSFLEVQRSASRFLGKSAVRSWIFGICANVVRHHVRSEVRRKKLTAAYATLPPPTERSPHDEMERQEQMDRLAAGLNRLSHKLRVAFVMCDVEGISGVEAARMLGLRQGTLWRRLHEARKALAASIEGRHVP
ncbi:MAG: RNA polymerase sigma factor [Myxococcota bacterium]|nr:RNA polymerase sigma factor [Myxococcota bacterium]